MQRTRNTMSTSSHRDVASPVMNMSQEYSDVVDDRMYSVPETQRYTKRLTVTQPRFPKTQTHMQHTPSRLTSAWPAHACLLLIRG
jgi:hypothetical protein